MRRRVLGFLTSFLYIIYIFCHFFFVWQGKMTTSWIFVTKATILRIWKKSKRYTYEKKSRKWQERKRTREQQKLFHERKTFSYYMYVEEEKFFQQRVEPKWVSSEFSLKRTHQLRTKLGRLFFFRILVFDVTTGPCQDYHHLESPFKVIITNCIVFSMTGTSETVDSFQCECFFWRLQDIAKAMEMWRRVPKILGRTFLVR